MQLRCMQLSCATNRSGVDPALVKCICKYELSSLDLLPDTIGSGYKLSLCFAKRGFATQSMSLFGADVDIAVTSASTRACAY